MGVAGFVPVYRHRGRGYGQCLARQIPGTSNWPNNFEDWLRNQKLPDK